MIMCACAGTIIVAAAVALCAPCILAVAGGGDGAPSDVRGFEGNECNCSRPRPFGKSCFSVVPPVDIHIRKPQQVKKRPHHHRLRGHEGETEASKWKKRTFSSALECGPFQINRPVVLNVDDRGGLLEDVDERSVFFA